jgi:hypothetical protein
LPLIYPPVARATISLDQKFDDQILVRHEPFPARKKCCIFKESIASDVNHLKAADLSCAVEAHPKKKTRIREIRAVVDELLIDLQREFHVPH